jgi:hypothetical protein
LNVRKKAIRGSRSRQSFLLAAENVGKEYHGRNGTSSKVLQVLVRKPVKFVAPKIFDGKRGDADSSRDNS